MERIQMERIIIYANAVCNLRCKQCAEYIPYIAANPPYYPAEQIKKALYEYFCIVSHVKMIVLSGGEPFISENTAILAEFLADFKEQYDKLEIMTNGTLIPSERLLKACVKNEKALIFINDYGELSPKVEELSVLCDNMNVRKNIRKYYGDDAHCGGWYDLKILSGLRIEDEEQLKARFCHCTTGNNPHLGLSFGLFGGRLFACAISGVVARMGLMEDTTAYVDLCDDNLSHKQKCEQILSFKSQEYLPACVICHGTDDRGKIQRFTPAKQLS